MLRRRFLQLVPVAVLTLQTRPLNVLVGITPRLRVLADPRMFAQLAGTTTIRAVGHAYREAHPLENDRTMLARHIGETAPVGSTTLANKLDDVIRVEYGLGETVQVNGWVLARTEARQCALYSLLYA